MYEDKSERTTALDGLVKLKLQGPADLGSNIDSYNYELFKSSQRLIQEQGVIIAEQLGLETEDDTST